MKELMPGVVVYKNSIKNIDKLLSLMKNVEYYQITGGRDVDICYIDNQASENLLDIKWILQESLDPCLEDYCSKYKIDGITPENWQLVRYGEGQQFVTHLDENYNMPRTVSLTMYLNDDYTGGEIEYVWFNLKYKPEAGDIVMFPSNYIFSHKVNTVLSGIRYAVVRFYKWKTLTDFPKKEAD